MNVTLRRWRTGDAAALAKILGEGDIHRTIADLPQPYTEKTALDYIAFCINADVNNFWSFAIECDGELSGCISAERGKNVYRQSAEIGYYIAKQLWAGELPRRQSKILLNLFLKIQILSAFIPPYLPKISPL